MKTGYFAVLLICVGWLGLLISTGNGQTPPQLTAVQWQADLRFMSEQMEHQHPNLFRRVPKTEFDAAVRDLNDRIPTLNQDEIITGFMHIVALVRDGHTGLFPRPYFRNGIFPVRFYQFDDGLFIQRAAPQYAELAGAKVIRIGKLSAAEALQKAGTITSADNEMGILDGAPMLLSIPELMHGLGVINSADVLSLVIESGGKEKTIDITATLSVNELIDPPADWSDFAAKKPLYLTHANELYWFEYLADQKVLYVQENGVANRPDEPIDRFYNRVMAFVAANPVNKLVIDIRKNGGGNNGLNRPIVIGIIKSKMDERGKLFVVTGRSTFSAAQNFVNEFEKYTNAIFVGEPSAGHPNHYGDNRPITLPNSRLDVRVSTLYWQDMDPRDNRKWTAPEIAATLTSADYRNGIDPVMQAIIGYRLGTSFQDLIQSAAKSTDITDFARRYDEFKSDPSHRFVATETAVNRLGYDLMQGGRAADAVEVFKLNVKANPGSANVYDSLGDGYQALGKRDEAIKAYEKAVSIDPNYASSLEALRKLKGK